MLITLHFYILISKFGIDTSFSHEITRIMFQNDQQRKLMDSDAGSYTYVVHLLHR